MEFLKIRALRGPNIWARCTALEVAVDLGEMKFPVREIPGFETRMPTGCRRCTSSAAPPGRKARAAAGVAHAGARARAGRRWPCRPSPESPVAFSRTMPRLRPGVARVIVEYREEEVGRSAFETARSLIDAAIHDRPFDVPAAVVRSSEISTSRCVWGPARARSCGPPRPGASRPGG